MSMRIGDKFKLTGCTAIFTVVSISMENGAFGPQLCGHTESGKQTLVLSRHEGYTFDKVSTQSDSDRSMLDDLLDHVSAEISEKTKP